MEKYNKNAELASIARGFGEVAEPPEPPDCDDAVAYICSLFFEASTDRPIRDHAGVFYPIPAHLLKNFVKEEIGEDRYAQTKLYKALRVLDIWQIGELNKQVSQAYRSMARKK